MVHVVGRIETHRRPVGPRGMLSFPDLCPVAGFNWAKMISFLVFCLLCWVEKPFFSVFIVTCAIMSFSPPQVSLEPGLPKTQSWSRWIMETGAIWWEAFADAFWRLANYVCVSFPPLYVFLCIIHLVRLEVINWCNLPLLYMYFWRIFVLFGCFLWEQTQYGLSR